MPVLAVGWFMASQSRTRPVAGTLLDVNGTPTHVTDEGQGQPLVLIHGAGASGRDFTFSMTGKLKDRFRVITIDRPGHGQTDRIKGRSRDAESLAEQSDLIRGALDQLGVARALVAGQSFGGAVSLNYTLRHPDAVAGLVVIAGVSNPWTTPLDPWYRINGTWLGQTVFLPMISALAYRSKVQERVDSIFVPDRAPTGYLDHLGIKSVTRSSQLRANVQQINSLLDDVKAQYQDYGTIRIPVEIIHGTADTIVPFDVHARPLSSQVPDVRLTALEGVGHMPQHSNEADVIEVIDRVAKRAGLR